MLWTLLALLPNATTIYEQKNLLVLSKLLERLVACQLRDYLTSVDLLPPLQSSLRPGHSTETAVLQVLSDISR